MKVNEEAAKKAAKALNTTLRQIEKKQGGAENDLGEMFATLHSDLDLRHAQLLGGVDNVKKVAMKEKDEAEYAAAEFAGFCSFTEGLLTLGTPLEIAGSHKEASAHLLPFLSSFPPVSLPSCSFFQVQTRNETLEKLKFPAEPSVQRPPSFDATNLEHLKKAISSFGSIKH